MKSSKKNRGWRSWPVMALALGLLLSGGVHAAKYNLFLSAVGGVHDGDTLWTLEFPPVMPKDLSTIDVDETEEIDWSSGGTTGIFDVTDIQINYFGTTYDLNDAIGEVTAEWRDGQMTGVNYVTADFSLELDPSYNFLEWQGRVLVSEVPAPGAVALFSLALGSLGLRVGRKDHEPVDK